MAALFSFRIASAARRGATGVTAGLALGLTLAGPSQAAPLTLPDDPFAYVVIRQDLRGFLREFTAWAGIYLSMERSTQGMVDGPLPDLPPEQLLDRVTAEHGLYWWFDGAVLHVGPASDIETASIPLPAGRAEQAAKSLESLALVEERFPVRVEPSLGLISATGPKPYIQKITDAVSAVASDAEIDRAGWRRVRMLRNGQIVEVWAPEGRVLSGAAQ